MILLRDYQKEEKGLAGIRAAFMRGARKVCFASPTGSGKTIVFAYLVHRIAENGQRVVIVVHRQELIDQTCTVLAEEGIEYGVIAAGYSEHPTALVQVGMAQTLVNRLDRLNGTLYLIVDETHHVMAATWLTILGAVPAARVLGVSATPERLDGKGLGEVFDALVLGPSVKELITDGWLSPFVVYAPERLVDLKGARTVAGDYALGDLARRMNADVVLNDALLEYRKHLDGKSAIAFCVTIAHSRDTARYFRAAGIRAQHLDGDTPREERRRLIAALASGEGSSTAQLLRELDRIAHEKPVPGALLEHDPDLDPPV